MLYPLTLSKLRFLREHHQFIIIKLAYCDLKAIPVNWQPVHNGNTFSCNGNSQTCIVQLAFAMSGMLRKIKKNKAVMAFCRKHAVLS